MIAKKTRSKCGLCPMRGYSADICKLHHGEKLPSMDDDECFWVYWGGKAAIGAGVGMTGMVAGLAVLPAFGMKAILHHFIAAKMTGVGGFVGAGTNVAATIKKKSAKKKLKKKTVLLPRNLGGLSNV